MGNGGKGEGKGRERGDREGGKGEDTVEGDRKRREREGNICEKKTTTTMQGEKITEYRERIRKIRTRDTRAHRKLNQ